MALIPKLHHINDWLANESALSRYLRISRGFAHLNNLLREQLPKELEPSVRIRFYRDGELALNVATGSVAMRIKMLAPSLIVDLAGHRVFNKLVRISVKVRPEAEKQRGKTEPLYVLSEENCRLLESVAGETKDEELKKSLLKLAHRVP